MLTAELVLVNTFDCVQCLNLKRQEYVAGLTRGHGMHARTAAIITQCASTFECNIHFTHHGRRVNGKSIMGVMMLALDVGKAFTVEVDGSDEYEALESLARHFVHGIPENKCSDFLHYVQHLEDEISAKLQDMNALRVLSGFSRSQIERKSCSRGKVCQD